MVGKLPVTIEHNNQRVQLDLLVVAGNGPSLMGRNWLESIHLDWPHTNRVHGLPLHSPLGSLLSHHAPLFQEGLGTIQTHKATIQVAPDAPIRFFRPRPVPFAIRDAVGAQLDKLEQDGVLEKITHSSWAAPIVVVPKKDGNYRLCGDYKVTVNAAMDVDRYPLPKPEEIFASLAGGKLFSKLDLSQAYQQLLLSEESKDFTTINTHQGLYRYNRLPFGIAPAIFQKTMDAILHGIPQVACYIDDIIVTGKDDNDHLSNLQQVFQRLQENGLRLKQSKCELMKDSIEYFGYRIDAQGLHPVSTKVEAIINAPPPTNQQQLKSFLGLLSYYGKFIPNMATLTHTLNRLLHNDTEWVWDSACQKAFSRAKQALASSSVLVQQLMPLPMVLGLLFPMSTQMVQNVPWLMPPAPSPVASEITHRLKGGSCFSIWG